MKLYLRLLIALSLILISCAVTACDKSNEHCEHEYVEYAVDCKCAEKGTRHLSCTKCGDIMSEEIDPTGHEIEIIAALPATCTENGTTEGRKCTRCGEYIISPSVITAGHKIQIQAAVPATCTEDGMTEGQYCTVCHKVIVIQEIIPASHNFEIITAIEPTCNENGRSEGKRCLDCGVIFSQSQVIPAGHVYEHLQALPATCTEPGYTEGYRCTRCGYIHSGLEVIPAGHITGVTPGKEGYSATCTTDGLSAEITCTVCNKVITAQDTIPAHGHSFEVVSGYPASCTSVGLVNSEACKYCDLVLAEQYKVPSRGHEFDENDMCVGCGIYVTDELVYAPVSSSDLLRGTVQYVVTGLKDGTNIDTVVIPDTFEGLPVVGIASNAFEGNTFIKRVIIPKSMAFIGENAFNGCTNLCVVECFDFSQSDAWGASWYGDAEFIIAAVYNYGKTPYETYIDAINCTAALTDYTRSSARLVSLNGSSISDMSVFTSEQRDGNNYLKWSASDPSKVPDTILGYVDGYMYIKTKTKDTYRVSASYEYWLHNAKVGTISADFAPADFKDVEFHRDLDGKTYIGLSACPYSVMDMMRTELSNNQVLNDSDNIKSSYTCVIDSNGIIERDEYKVELNESYIFEGSSSLCGIGTTSIDTSSDSVIAKYDAVHDTSCLLVHTVVNIDRVEPTCFTPGHSTYAYCSVCRDTICEVTTLDPTHKYEDGKCTICGCTNDISN